MNNENLVFCFYESDDGKGYKFATEMPKDYYSFSSYFCVIENEENSYYVRFANFNSKNYIKLKFEKNKSKDKLIGNLEIDGRNFSLSFKMNREFKINYIGKNKKLRNKKFIHLEPDFDQDKLFDNFGYIAIGSADF